jgi:RecG-like helicase
MIHGQLSSEEKQAAMDSFSKPDSEIKILVATSVIEVW